MVLLWQRGVVPDWVPESLKIHLPGLASRGRAIFLLVGSVAVLHALGLVDDMRRLGPGVKLLVQMVVAFILVVFAEIRFSFFIESELFAAALSILWLLVIINAFNFLDNMDGLCTGIAIISGTMILAAAISSGQVFVSGLLALLIGSLAGFLLYNFAPAKIFLGDAGSLVVGLLMGVLSIRTTYYHEANSAGQWYGAMVPLLVLAVPLYDFCSVMIIRLLSGKSPFVGDTQHFSHRLVRLGLSRRDAVLTIYIATCCTGLGATFLHQVSQPGAAVILIQTILILLIIAILEYHGQDENSEL